MKSGRVINTRFHDYLSAQGYTVGTLAEAIGSGRSHVSSVLNNAPPDKGQKFGAGRGGRTRRKLAAYFLENFPDGAAAMLESLGWDKDGRIICVEQRINVPRGEPHVGHCEHEDHGPRDHGPRTTHRLHLPGDGGVAAT